MQALHRKYEMYIGVNPQLSPDYIDDINVGAQDKPLPPLDTRTIPFNRYYALLTEHHFEAKISYPRSGDSKQATTQTFNIYNPPKYVLEQAKVGNMLVLKAGYNTDKYLPIICATQITSVLTTREGADRILMLTTSEAYTARRSHIYNGSFSADQTYAQAISIILQEFNKVGVPTGYVDWGEGELYDYLDDSGKPTGYRGQSDGALDKQFGMLRVVHGRLGETLTDLCKGCGLKWYMAGGKVNIQPVKRSQNVYINVLQVNQNNIKDAIELYDDTIKEDKKKKTDRSRGIKLTVNLNGNVNKADGLEVYSNGDASSTFSQHEGRYLIEQVDHNLSYEGSAWDTTIEAKG